MNRLHLSERERLSDGVRREIGGEMTTRFFRSLPLFRTVEIIPDQLRELLDRLEEREGLAGHVPGRHGTPHKI